MKKIGQLRYFESGGSHFEFSHIFSYYRHHEKIIFFNKLMTSLDFTCQKT